MTKVSATTSPDLVAISKGAQWVRESLLLSTARGNKVREAYMDALRNNVGRRVVASYEFVGILIGRTSGLSLYERPQYTKLGHPVVRTEVEVVIDKVQGYDGSVYVRHPEGTHGTHYTAEQAGVDNLVIHDVIDVIES